MSGLVWLVSDPIWSLSVQFFTGGKNLWKQTHTLQQNAYKHLFCLSSIRCDFNLFNLITLEYTPHPACQCHVREALQKHLRVLLSVTNGTTSNQLKESHVYWMRDVCANAKRACGCRACSSFKPRSKTKVTRTPLWGLSSLHFINSGGHSQRSAGHELGDTNSKTPERPDNSQINCWA